MKCSGEKVMIREERLLLDTELLDIFSGGESIGFDHH